MDRRKLILVLLSLIVLAAAQTGATGVGFSYYFPFNGEGGLGIGLGAGLEFSPLLSLQGKISYFQFDGLPSDIKWASDDEGWFKTKTFLFDLMGRFEIPTGGAVRPYLLSGPAFVWNFRVDSDEGQIDRDYRVELPATTLNTDFDYDGKTGFGLSVGGGAELDIGEFTLDLGVRYYRLRVAVDMNGSYLADGSGVPQPYPDDGSKMIMDGILALIGISFEN